MNLNGHLNHLRYRLHIGHDECSVNEPLPNDKKVNKVVTLTMTLILIHELRIVFSNLVANRFTVFTSTFCLIHYPWYC